MRIWDVPAGYLNRQSLLGEHRELHGLLSILVNQKKGYSRHPETRRWVDRVSALSRRHALLVAEMRLRGYVDRTPVVAAGPVRWPALFVTVPGQQYALLAAKYRGRDPGRIPLPRNAQQLWAQHKYSVMARDPQAYSSLGRRVARAPHGASLDSLAEELVVILRATPARGRLLNALAHMWGYASRHAPADETATPVSAAAILRNTAELALRVREPYLLASTALSELAVFVE